MVLVSGSVWGAGAGREVLRRQRLARTTGRVCEVGRENGDRLLLLAARG
jgi:hypothetical protein